MIDAINANETGEVAVFFVNKEKTTKVLKSAGNPIPRGLRNLDGYIHSINDPGSPVNIRIPKQTETKQFREWFEGSKVINPDGSPKEMYHGTSSGGFTVFNTYGGKFGLFGKGTYFTDNPEVADSYTRKGKGQNPEVYGVYLSSTENIGTFYGSNPDIRYQDRTTGTSNRTLLASALDLSALRGPSMSVRLLRTVFVNIPIDFTCVRMYNIIRKGHGFRCCGRVASFRKLLRPSVIPTLLDFRPHR